jgi:hypothetical protein
MIKYEECMPLMNQRLLWAFREPGGTIQVSPSIKEVTWDRNPYPEKQVRQINLPTMEDPKWEQLWATVPDENDKRWVNLYDKRPGYDEEVLCLRYNWEYEGVVKTKKPWVYYWAPWGHPIPFPGFLGAPMTREEGIVAWMRTNDVENVMEWKAVPRVELNKMTSWEWKRKERQYVVEDLATNISLSIINDGKLYKDIWEPICMGRYKGAVKSGNAGPWRRKGNREALIHSGGAGWSLLVFECANKVVDRKEQDRHEWYDAVMLATPVVLDYYVAHAKELAA